MSNAERLKNLERKIRLARARYNARYHIYA